MSYILAPNKEMGLSENSVPLNPMVLLIIIPTKWLFHWGYTQHFQTYPNKEMLTPLLTSCLRLRTGFANTLRGSWDDRKTIVELLFIMVFIMVNSG